LTEHKKETRSERTNPAKSIWRTGVAYRLPNETKALRLGWKFFRFSGGKFSKKREASGTFTETKTYGWMLLLLSVTQPGQIIVDCRFLIAG